VFKQDVFVVVVVAVAVAAVVVRQNKRLLKQFSHLLSLEKCILET